jgi:hypothetical protein
MIKLAATLALALGALVPVLTPCATEDSTVCNWDGHTSGNGAGASYIALTEDISIRYSEGN